MGSGHTHPAPLHESFIGRLDARAKILAVVPAVLFVNVVGAAHWPAVLAVGGMFAAAMALCGRGALQTARRGLVMLPFVAFVVLTLPFAMPGNEVLAFKLGAVRLAVTDEGLARAGVTAAKACASLLGLLFLTGATEAPDLFKGLRSLGMPKAFVAVLSVIYRYVFEMGDEFARMRRAAAARGFEMATVKAVPRMGTMAGALLARSLARAERVHQAMLARGFDGELRAISRTSFGRNEAVFVAVFYVLTAATAMVTYA